MEAIVNSAEIASAVTLKNVLGHQAATPFYIWANEDCDNRTDSFDEAKEIRLSFFNLGMANVHICDANGVEVVDREIEAHEALVSAGYFAGERRPDVKPTFPGCFMVNDPEDPQGFAIVGDGIGALILEAYDQLIEPEDASPQVQDPVSSGADCTVLQAGACQGSCRLIYAAKGCLRSAFMWSATTESRSGLRVTAPIGDQSRVVPDQRAGLRSRALRYSSCRAARMA